MSDRPYFDKLETRPPEDREATLFAQLSAQVSHAKLHAPYFSALFEDLHPGDVSDRAALAKLPVTRKSDLVDIQKPGQPLGGMNAGALGTLRRIYQSPGPTYDAEGHGENWWRMARGLYAAGMRKGDIVHNTFSYHLTPAGLMVDAGAQAIGCAVVPAGVGNTDLQVRAIADIRPHNSLRQAMIWRSR